MNLAVYDDLSSISSGYDTESSFESYEDNFEVGVEIHSSNNLELSFLEKDPRIDVVVSRESSIGVIKRLFLSLSSIEIVSLLLLIYCFFPF